MGFHINSRSSHATQCVKSRINNKAIYYILCIDAFEQQCVMIKGMLKSPRLEDHTKVIGIYQLLCNRSSFEHRCMNKIKKIYQHAGKYDNRQNLRDILDAAMVLTTEEVTDESLHVSMTSTSVPKTMLGNHCVFSPTNLMLKIKQKYVVFELQNKNAEP